MHLIENYIRPGDIKLLEWNVVCVFSLGVLNNQRFQFAKQKITIAAVISEMFLSHNFLLLIIKLEAY